MKTLQFLLIAAVGVILVSSRAVEEKRLIKTSADEPGQWMDESEIFELIRRGTTFMDITGIEYTEINPDNVNVKAIPTEPKFQETVRQVLTKLNSQRVQDFVEHFSSYHNRYYSSVTGGDSQKWLTTQVQASIQGYPGRAEVFEVDHGYVQKSIVARLEGSDPTLKSEVVILGAHLDSVNRNGASLQAPGADDNASGSVVILEALRDIVESGLILKRTVEFQWYAAEEIGLRGSQAIAEDYKRTNIDVVGMLNIDVAGYHQTGIDDIGVFTDNGNSQVIQFLRVLTDEYLDYGRRDSTCGYGCSDHASWTNQGYPAAMASEYVTNPYMHTVQDNFERVNFEQVNEFIKIVVGFSIELGEPSS